VFSESEQLNSGEIRRSGSIEASGLQVCARCIYDERVSAIEFDDEGVCKYCRQVELLIEQYGTGQPKGVAELERLVVDIRESGRGKKYDCIIGVSGGTDSSYLVWLAKEWGLRPLAVHYDNTWNSAIATQDIRKVLDGLDVDLHTHVVDNKEADDIFRAFFLAGVPEIEASTDLGYAELLRRVAASHGVSYVLEGHSFVAEGVTPLGKNYFDGRYIREIHRAYGRRPMKTYPLMTFARFMRWSLISRVRMIRPFWYMDYSKETAKEFLSREYGWEYYGGHHLENRMTAFFHSVYLPEKYGSDMRNNTLSALARQGTVSREDAWKEYNQPPHIEPELVEYFCKRLGFSDDEFEAVMRSKPRFWWEFPTYKRRFERLRPLFRVLAAANLVPMSFYLKYCFPAKIEA
jgi:N-acetyl sugar amidotransferase